MQRRGVHTMNSFVSGILLINLVSGQFFAFSL